MSVRADYPGQLPLLDSVWQYTEFKTQPLPNADSWWKIFNDPDLQRVVALAVENNYDIRGALKRLESSRTQLRSVYSDYYPTFGLNLGYSNERSSGRQTKPYVSAEHLSYFQAGISASWEIDIFGRVAANAKAAKQEVKLSRMEYDAMMVTIAANAASEYFSYRSYQAQLAMSGKHIESQKELQAIAKARYEAGLVPKLDVVQANILLYNIEESVPDIECGVSTSLNALATLCAVSPAELDGILNQGTNGTDIMQNIPEAGPVGLPADMIRRRPDVVEAEIQLAILAAKTGIAKKEFLPTLSLNADVGFSGHNLGNMWHKDGMYFSVAPTLSWTIFEGMARKYAVVEARQELEASVADYNNTLLSAFAEVNNSMASNLAARERLNRLGKIETESVEELALALDRYKLGLCDFSDVVDAQESLLDSQNDIIEARTNLLQSIVTLYEALGGGWEN